MAGDRAHLTSRAFLRADGAELHKKPATAELLAWLRLLLRSPEAVEGVIDKDSKRINRTLSVMVKTRPDRKSAEEAVKRRQR